MPDSPQSPEVPRLLVPVPAILRALASYLEATGEAEKFGRHLIAAIDGAGFSAEVLQASSEEEPLGGTGGHEIVTPPL